MKKIISHIQGNNQKLPEYKLGPVQVIIKDSFTKNIDILSRIIKAYTNVNDLDLDCFMGSGSTAIACKQTNRDYIGCELDTD